MLYFVLIRLFFVGKRNITQRYCYDVFDPHDKLTIGVDFTIKTVEIHGKRIKLQIWDVEGEERFGILIRNRSGDKKIYVMIEHKLGKID